MSDDPAIFGLDLFGDPIRPKASGPVAARFTFPPFSVLDARAGEWQDRKRAWLAMGIKSEAGRAAELQKTGAGSCYGGTSSWAGQRGGAPAENGNAGGGSIFDPVLAELAYRWWCPPGGQIVDPFAGGSVRGIVAGALGFRYWGGDLRAEQIAANRAQADAIPVAVRPEWVCGDSAETLAGAPRADFVFSCPPYGDLERYSDDPADLSAMPWDAFLGAYGRVIRHACGALRPDRFACFVVGDFRDNRGHYRNFVSETIGAFKAAGLDLYNEAILLGAVGSAALRVTKQFDAGRKLVKVHQNVLVFVKGDWRKAAAPWRAEGRQAVPAGLTLDLETAATRGGRVGRGRVRIWGVWQRQPTNPATTCLKPSAVTASAEEGAIVPIERR